MPTLGFCERPGCSRRRTSDRPLRFHPVPRRPHGTETRPSVKEMVPVDSNTVIWTMRSAGRGAAPSPALPANTCMTPLGDVSGHLFDFGPVGRFVVTDCHNTGDTPWEAGDTGGLFSQLAGNADTPWEVGDAFGWTGGQVVAGSNPVSPTTKYAGQR